MLPSFFPQGAVTQSSVLVNTQAVNLTWTAPMYGFQNVAFWYDTDWKKYWQHAFVTANVAWSLHVADLVPLKYLGYIWRSYIITKYLMSISSWQNISIFFIIWRRRWLHNQSATFSFSYSYAAMGPYWITQMHTMHTSAHYTHDHVHTYVHAQHVKIHMHLCRAAGSFTIEKAVHLNCTMCASFLKITYVYSSRIVINIE